MRIGKRRRALAMGLAVIAAAGIASPLPLQRAAADVGRAPGVGSPSSSSSGISGVTFSLVSAAAASQPSVSGTGERVVFVAAPGSADGRTSSVWLKDRGTDELTELSLPNPNVRVGDSVDPVISADGCIVVIATQISYDLFRDDDLGSRWDIYRMTLPACGGALNDWTLVSTQLNKNGIAEARGDVIVGHPAAVSGSGTIVAYLRPMTVQEEVPVSMTVPNVIEVVDLAIPVDDPTHTATAPGLPIDLGASSTQYVGMDSPSVSADGSIVVFTSDAKSELPVPEWQQPIGDGTSAAAQVYSWDRDEADPFLAVTLISTGSSGQANASATSPAVTGDARFVAYSSAASNLVASPEFDSCATSCAAQVYVVDRDTDNNQILDEPDTVKTSIVSAVYSDDDGEFAIGNGASFTPTISSDGNTLAFVSQADNLLEVQTPGGGDVGDGDVITADLTTRTLRRSFDIPSPTPGAYSHPRLSANSRVLVADTLTADRLVDDPAITGRHIVAATYVPAVSMADLDLGTVLVKVLGPEWYINVINSGPGTFAPATVTSDNPDFAITGGTCTDLAAVPAGQTCSVKVTLKPSLPGPSSSTLTVAEAGFGAVTLTAKLTGSGGEPALLAKPAAGTFDATVVGETNAAALEFDIFNIYSSPIAITSVSVVGANKDDFVVDAEQCLAATAIQTTVIEVPVVTTTTAPPVTAPPATEPVTETTAAPAADGSGTDPAADPAATAAPTTAAPTTAAPATAPPATAVPTNEVTTEIITEVVPGVGFNTSCKVSVTFTPGDAGTRTASVSIGSSVNEYTSMLVSGVGVYTPSLVGPAAATPGRDITIGGTGYPSNASVVIGWNDGSGHPLNVETDEHGKFVTSFRVGLGQNAGNSTLVAQVANGPSASLVIDVERLRRRTSGARG